MLQVILLAVIAVVLGGILAAVKSGFNEVIKALESIDERLGNSSLSS